MKTINGFPEDSNGDVPLVKLKQTYECFESIYTFLGNTVVISALF